MDSCCPERQQADWKVWSSDLNVYQTVFCTPCSSVIPDPCRSSELTDLLSHTSPTVAWRSSVAAMPRWSSADVGLDMRRPRLHQWPRQPFGDARKVVLDQRQLGRVLHERKTLLGKCPETAVPRLGIQIGFWCFLFWEDFDSLRGWWGKGDPEAKIWCKQIPRDLRNVRYSSSKVHGPLTLFVCGCLLLSKWLAPGWSHYLPPNPSWCHDLSHNES